MTNHHHPHVVPLARISLTLSRHSSLSFIASGKSSVLHPVSSQSCCIVTWISKMTNHHHPHVVPLAQISLTLSRHSSLSFIASGKSSVLHPVSSQSCCIVTWISKMTNHHHPHVVPLARISLTLSRHSSLSFVASGKSSVLHPVSSQSCGIVTWISKMTNHHHPHVVPLARISLTLSRHSSLSFVASGKSSVLHPVSSQSCCIVTWISKMTNHHHPHVVPLARISLTLSRHSSLSFIASGKSSVLHPVSSQSCCM